MKTENKLRLQIITKISKGPSKHKNNFSYIISLILLSFNSVAL